ncbi:MAG: LTA synthase family protein [Bdellovibrionales bacterium]|nr:LTA synthase family protein [Bdellovibrionales bacterium]MBT3526295.1 LTA synthase family protein [Bdellovibrionales bacterium]MBT7670204.1 LTA synthase family protein [Bdellovibrionales bacterium]
MWSLYGLYTNLVSIILIFFYSEAINRGVKNNFFRALFGISVIVLYFALAKYHYRVKASFDLAVVFDNLNEMFNKEALGVIENTFKGKDFYHVGLSIPLLIGLQYFRNIFTKNVLINRKYALSYVVGFFLLISIGPFPYGEISYAVKSAYEIAIGGFPKTENYSKLNPLTLYSRRYSGSSKKRPHIFLVTLESYSSLYIEKKNVHGKEITPTLNKLIPEGLYVDDFYGNSIQTIKGQFAIFCSRISMLKGKSSYLLDGKKLTCAPKIFEQLGYSTLFHKCFNSLDFDNTGNFVTDLGFDVVLTTNMNKLSPEEKNTKIWGWGVQDDISYLQYVDNVLDLAASSNKPIFSTVHTVSHHMKFRKVPLKQRFLFKQPNSKEEYFLNSLHLSDLYLNTFIEKLKDEGLYDSSIIVITGDHSYPAGEHGYYDNQTSYYQEFFKTPLLIIWKDGLSPKRVTNKSYSHIDVLPTLLDILDREIEVNLAGKSILKNEDSTAYLVQPYNGVYLGVVQYPYKYVWERRTDREYLFNIKNDKNEKKPIENDKIIELMRKQRDYIIYNDEFLNLHFRL